MRDGKAIFLLNKYGSIVFDSCLVDFSKEIHRICICNLWHFFRKSVDIHLKMPTFSSSSFFLWFHIENYNFIDEILVKSISK